MSLVYKIVPTSRLLYIHKVLLSCKTNSQIRWAYIWGVNLLSKMPEDYDVVAHLYELQSTKNEVVKRIGEVK